MTSAQHEALRHSLERTNRRNLTTILAVNLTLATCLLAVSLPVETAAWPGLNWLAWLCGGLGLLAWLVVWLDVRQEKKE